MKRKIIYLSFVGLSFFQPIIADARKTVFDKDEIEKIVEEIALSNGIDPLLASALAFHESGYDPMAVSRKGARGVMQLMPETAAELGVKNPYDPRQNIRGGIRYLSKLIRKYGDNDLETALAAYNYGQGRVDSLIEEYGWLDNTNLNGETRKYVEKVLQTYKKKRKEKSGDSRIAMTGN